jgi:hypothetical protein
MATTKKSKQLAVISLLLRDDSASSLINDVKSKTLNSAGKIKYPVGFVKIAIQSFIDSPDDFDRFNPATIGDIGQSARADKVLSAIKDVKDARATTAKEVVDAFIEGDTQQLFEFLTEDISHSAMNNRTRKVFKYESELLEVSDDETKEKLNEFKLRFIKSKIKYKLVGKPSTEVMQEYVHKIVLSTTIPIKWKKRLLPDTVIFGDSYNIIYPALDYIFEHPKFDLKADFRTPQTKKSIAHTLALNSLLNKKITVPRLYANLENLMQEESGKVAAYDDEDEAMPHHEKLKVEKNFMKLINADVELQKHFSNYVALQREEATSKLNRMPKEDYDLIDEDDSVAQKYGFKNASDVGNYFDKNPKVVEAMDAMKLIQNKYYRPLVSDLQVLSRFFSEEDMDASKTILESKQNMDFKLDHVFDKSHLKIEDVVEMLLDIDSAFLSGDEDELTVLVEEFEENPVEEDLQVLLDEIEKQYGPIRNALRHAIYKSIKLIVSESRVLGQTGVKEPLDILNELGLLRRVVAE